MNRKQFAAALGVPEALTLEGRHRLSRSQVKANPQIRWNAFVDIISASPESFPSGPSRWAALVFVYESEVQNGGHKQYFSNTECKFADETILALGKLGDQCRARVLAEAYLHFVENCEVLGDEFDDAFHDCEPSLSSVLEAHLDGNEGIYVEWEQ